MIKILEMHLEKLSGYTVVHSGKIRCEFSHICHVFMYIEKYIQMRCINL